MAWPADPPPDPADLAWLHRHNDHDADQDHNDRNDNGDDGPGDDQAGHGHDHDSVGGPGAETPPAGHRHSSASPSGRPDPVDTTTTSGPDTQRDPCHDNPHDANAAQVRSGPPRPPLPDGFRPPGWRPLTPAQLAACAPTVVMHVHLTEQTLRDGHGVVRTDWGPILLEQLQRFLVHHEAQLKIYPVIDPADTAAADSYETPLRLRRAMAIRHPRSVFPHSPTSSSRTDLDHTPAYLRNGPPGQTGMHTLGPLARCEHRAKTVGRWRSKQPEPGTYLWRSPEGWIMITTNQGTLTLGHTTWATQLWDAATTSTNGQSSNCD